MAINHEKAELHDVSFDNGYIYVDGAKIAKFIVDCNVREIMMFKETFDDQSGLSHICKDDKNV